MLDYQAADFQDFFVTSLCTHSGSKTFVDVGCSYAHNKSNVASLAVLGWTGVGFDIDNDIIESWKPFEDAVEIHIVDVVADIAKINAAVSRLPSTIDYLNIDVDGYPCQYVAENMDFSSKRYRCITIEHDAYRFGDVYKLAERKALLSHGYEIVVQTAAEDWYVDPNLVDSKYLAQLRTIPADYVMCWENREYLRKYLGAV